MKNSIVIFALFSFLPLKAQEKSPTYSAFAIDHKEVVWVQVFHAHQPKDTLFDHVYAMLKRKPWIKNLHTDASEIVADIDNFMVDYKRYGGKYMNTSNLIRTGRWSGKIRISFKDGKYRVLVYGLSYTARQPAMQAGKMSNASHVIHGSWTDWVLNDYRTRFKERRHLNMDIMHFNLKDGFTLREIDFIDEDW